MHAILSGRALIQFFILEFLLLGGLTLIGEIPWWFWIIGSALLYATLWVHDNRRLVRLWLHRAPRGLLVFMPAVLVLLLAGGGVIYWATQDARTGRGDPIGTLDHALLTVVKVATKQLHDPIKMEVVVANVGRLPTIKAQIHIGFLVADAPTPATEVDKKFADLFADKDRLAMYDQTSVPGLGKVLKIWTNEVTEKVIEEVRSGKKNFFVFLVAEYTDAKTPPGRRLVTEVAFRSSPTAAPMRGWSHVRERTYLSD